MRWAGKDTTIEIQSDIVAIDEYLQFERVIFVKKSISISACYSYKVIGDVLANKQSRDKILLSTITAPIYGASY
jgi:hypothetical protein